VTDPTPKKFDTDKPRYDLLPPKALGLLVDCLTYGAKKYDDYNWRKDGGIDPNRLFAATQRHLWAWKEGEVLDKESGLPHLAHAATNLLMMLDLASRPPVKIPNFSPPSAVEKPGPTREFEAGWPKKPVFEDGPREVAPATEISKIKTCLLYENPLAYEIASEPEDVRHFPEKDVTARKLEKLKLFTKVSSFTNSDGQKRWTYSRTPLGHAVREAIHAKS